MFQAVGSVLVRGTKTTRRVRLLDLSWCEGKNQKTFQAAGCVVV